MTDYNAPETALLDLDWLLDQAGLFITANAVDCAWEARLEEYTKANFNHCGGLSAPEICAMWMRVDAVSSAVDYIRQSIKSYLAHLSVEEVYDPYLDRMGKLELAARKAEVDRRIARMLRDTLPTTRQAA